MSAALLRLCPLIVLFITATFLVEFIGGQSCQPSASIACSSFVDGMYAYQALVFFEVELTLFFVPAPLSGYSGLHTRKLHPRYSRARSKLAKQPYQLSSDCGTVPIQHPPSYLQHVAPTLCN